MPFGVFKKIIGAPLKVASKLLPGQAVKKAIGGGSSSSGSGGSFSKYGAWAGDDAPRHGYLPYRRSLPGYTMGYGGGPPSMYGYGRGPPMYGGYGYGGGFPYPGYYSPQPPAYGYGGGYGGGYGWGYPGMGGYYSPSQWSTPWGSPVRPPPHQQAPQQGFDFESFAKEWKNRPPGRITMDMVRVRKPDGSIASVNRNNPIFGATTVEGSGYTVDRTNRLGFGKAPVWGGYGYEPPRLGGGGRLQQPSEIRPFPKTRTLPSTGRKERYTMGPVKFSGGLWGTATPDPPAPPSGPERRTIGPVKLHGWGI